MYSHSRIERTCNVLEEWPGEDRPPGGPKRPCNHFLLWLTQDGFLHLHLEFWVADPQVEPVEDESGVSRPFGNG